MLENGLPLSRIPMINIHKKKSVDVLFWANIEPNKRGSFEDFMLCLSQEAMNQGLKIKFVFGNKVSDYYKAKNIDYLPTNINNLNSAPFLRYILKKDQPRTVHFHFMGLASPMIFLSKIWGVKHIILTDHASSTCQLPPQKNMLINYLKKQKRALYLKRMDAIIAVSDFVAKRLDGLALRASPSGAVEESEGREAQPINAVRADAPLSCRTPQLRPIDITK